jgi:pimeloyl-ACP methyl ester carboxylesterase
MLSVRRRTAVAALVALAGASMSARGRAAPRAGSRMARVGGLFGTLTMPEAPGPVPAALIIAGSGPTDRDGNNPLGVKADSYRLLAEDLAALGVASLRYDKRGIGWSRFAAIGISEADFTLTTFVDDAVAMALWLKGQEGVGPVALLGHSEGGLIAMLGAEKARAAGLVLLCAGGRRFGDILREQLSRPGPPPEDVARAMRAIDALERGDTLDPASIPEGLETFFRPGILPFLRSELAVDPAQRLAALRQPAMIVGGGADIQITRADFDRLAAARPDAATLWLPDMSHTLKSAGSGPEGQRRAYTDASLPLIAGLAAPIARFISALRR